MAREWAPGWIVVDQRAALPAVGSQPLDRVPPMQHSVEAALFLVDLFAVMLGVIGQG